MFCPVRGLRFVGDFVLAFLFIRNDYPTPWYGIYHESNFSILFVNAPSRLFENGALVSRIILFCSNLIQAKPPSKKRKKLMIRKR